ncbi:MAG: multicopper oxidase domain-containing protein, partial [Acidimicrobiales bacterium]|nr:multicopper oxidase domain-containing protein [Acidimicrobiales bacterium]
GFGVHTLTTHEHNGHSPAESDGYANAFFFPGQYYDYRWPVPLAGHDSINTKAKDNRAGMPNGKGGIKKIPGDWRETMSTHWLHDHMLDYTAQNVYKGSVAMMNYYSALDRGNESIKDGVNLRLPSGDALDWGNRDYDVNLVLAEKAWDGDGQLWFNPFNIKGFIGDVMTVNWLYDPYIEVRARRYRFRILNGSVSRYFKVALVDEAGDRVPFHMVANDGNLMEHTVHFENGELPTQGIAERYDIVVDFSNFEPGDKLYFVNLLQHKNGQVTDVPIPLEDILSGEYQPVAVDDNGDGTADRWVDGDPVVGKFLEFRVKKYRGKDLSMNPAKYEPGGKTMIPLRQPTEDELANALHRTFEFERQPTDEKPWVIETDGGKGVGMDPRRLSAAPSKNSPQLEVWRLLNSGTWSHPVHIHFEEGIILRRGGVAPPEWEKWARKDVYRLGPQPDSTNMVEIALRFREFAGTYMEHCHNTQHEDHAMLLRWDIEHPGQVKLMPTPIPSWDGVTYVDSAALPTVRTGDDVGEYGPSLDDQAVEIWLDGMEVEGINLVDVEIGSALNPTEDERAVAKIPLQVGTNIDSDGNERTVYFVLHDVSDEALADEFGISWAGALTGTPEAATSEASFEGGEWTFYGDLPNPVLRGNSEFQTYPDSTTLGPPQLHTNTYSPLRRVTLNGKDVIVNAFYVQWGGEPWEQMRIDVNCDPSDPSSFPDDPPNTSCMYNGHVWSGDTGHALEINTTAAVPYARFKLHKSWTEGGDYLPYYMVLDTFPLGPANAMGIPYVPKHAFLGAAAVPLVQFIPPTPLTPPGWTGPPTYPPTAETPDLAGGGPLGGQIGIPTYFMPEDDYSPMWHIGFAHWIDETQIKVVRGIGELKFLRSKGYLMIGEFPPPPNMFTDNYDFENPASPHVVNCPTPVTIDTVVHGVNQKIKQVMASQ